VVGGLAAAITGILVTSTIRPVRTDIQALVGLARRARKNVAAPGGGIEPWS